MQTEKELHGKLRLLNDSLEGELHVSDQIRKIYATDASSYREIPIGVAYPAKGEDIQKLIHFARENHTSLIPRTAGTSLAGQVVGPGIIVDVSKYMNQIIEINTEEKWVRVQPGVVRDELNMFLKPYGFLFGPETSTSNRAMLGGMIGNNSCGSNSIVYGSTRDHLKEAHVLLSDGSEAILKEQSKEEFDQKCKEENFEGEIYRSIKAILAPEHIKQEIKKEFPLESIPRRNTGYAVDLLLPMEPFSANGVLFNFCKLLAGSEGTLGVVTEAKLNIEPLPPPFSGLICAHFDSIFESLKATQVAVKHDPSAVELMDHFILECTKESLQHRKNRFFLQGDPKAIIVVELRRDSEEELIQAKNSLIAELKSNNYGYHYPFIRGEQTASVWNLRKAGLGLLSNMPGDAKPVPVIEDTAVTVDDLPDFIKEFNEKLAVHNLECVHYAHAGSGEIHLRPILNLKTEKGNQLFRIVAEEIATLVKKYKGSLSGEHGDGRLRGEFIPFMVGEKNFEVIKKVKRAWDPDNIFNPGKIVDTPSMNSSLRFEPGQTTHDFDTHLDFSKTNGFIRLAEQCNGSGDCRKTHHIGGTMCPSYMATRDEKDTTRARANMIREVFTRSPLSDALQSNEIKDILDLCLSCKGCKLECPSNVDMAKLKSEFTSQYQAKHGIPLRSRLIGHISKINAVASKVPRLYNFAMLSPLGAVAKSILGISSKRNFPVLENMSLKKWLSKQQSKEASKVVYLFIDEFTNYSEVEIGQKTFKLLNLLGYDVRIIDHPESGRAALSKGLLAFAKKCALRNVALFGDIIDDNTPLIGIEPSAIFTFRDEYPDLLDGEAQVSATRLSKNVFLIDEFLASEFRNERIKTEMFVKDDRSIKLHGHCHQKALSTVEDSKVAMEIPKNYKVDVIPSGCCGMAGSFGFEKEHYDMSMKIGELVLFPEVRKSEEDILIAAPGTSCRHQILDGTKRKSFHPVEILFDALKPEFK